MKKYLFLFIVIPSFFFAIHTFAGLGQITYNTNGGINYTTQLGYEITLTKSLSEGCKVSIEKAGVSYLSNQVMGSFCVIDTIGMVGIYSNGPAYSLYEASDGYTYILFNSSHFIYETSYYRYPRGNASLLVLSPEGTSKFIPIFTEISSSNSIPLLKYTFSTGGQLGIYYSLYGGTYYGFQQLNSTKDAFENTTLYWNEGAMTTLQSDKAVIEPLTLVPLPTPTNLTQSIQSPLLEKEEVILGEKIGKYQSGSGMIFEAQVTNPTQNQVRLAVKYSTGTTENMIYSNPFLIGTGQVILPYSGTGNYIWSARVEKFDGTSPSSWVEYGNNPSTETDFTLYEGFEPYPYGYRFHNARINIGVLDGSTKDSYVLGFYNRGYTPGNKWDIFYTSFDASFANSYFGLVNQAQLNDAFEYVGLNNTGALSNGACFGMANSATMQYSHSGYLQQHYTSLFNQIGGESIWQSLSSLPLFNDRIWTTYDDIKMKSILAFQLSYKSKNMQNIEKNSIKTLTGILDQLKTYPNKTYILSFWGTDQNGNPAGHAVVPYKVEGKRIYVWDNNFQFPYRDIDQIRYISNQQYIEIDEINNTFTPVTYLRWQTFTKISLIDIDDLYNNNQKSTPIGFNGTDISYSLSGASDLYITNSLGQISGFKDGQILEEIPGVQVIIPLNATLDDTNTTDTTFKQIYLPVKQTNLTLKVGGTTTENYTLMIAGGDYYNKIEGVSTSSGQVDTFQTTGTGLTINFDDTKTGKYNFLFDNFHNYGPQNTGTGTVYIDSIPTNITLQSYSIDWTKVVQNTTDAVNYQVDTNNDGIIGNSGDTSTSLSPIFQDLTSPTTTATLSGTIVPDTTNSYYEQVQVNLTSQDNLNGSGVSKTYFTLDNYYPVFTEYTGPIIVNGYGNYTLKSYSIDKFGNKEPEQTKIFSIVQTPPPTNTGHISGYIYEDSNNNGTKDTGEKTMAGWKVCIDTNNNSTCEENSEAFQVSNNQGYYEFDSLQGGNYKILEILHQNWTILSPSIGYYQVTLTNGQQLTNKNFGNKNTKKK